MTGGPDSAGGPAPLPLRSALYVPATRPELLAKALASAADAVIVDLEDAVPAARKDEARAAAAEALAALGGAPPKPVQVRVNAPGSAHAEADAAMVAALPPGVVAAVRVPKVERPEQVRELAGLLGTGAGRPGLWLLVESALGLERALELATASPAVVAIGLGEADLRASLGLPVGSGDAGLAYARGRIVAVARAAGLPGPLQSAYTDVRDADGLRRSCAEGRALGFAGRNCVHPAQLEIVNEAFAPTEEEVVRAREIVAALNGAVDTGAGAVALPDGRFVDLAVVAQARATLALAGSRGAGAGAGSGAGAGAGSGAGAGAGA